MEGRTNPVTLLRSEKRSIHQVLTERCLRLRDEQNWAEALQCCWTIIRQCVRAGDSSGHALSLIHLAEIYRAMGQLGQAAYSFQQALRLFHLVADSYHEGVASWGLAQVQKEAHQDMNAASSYGLALKLFEKCRLRAQNAGQWDEADRMTALVRAAQSCLDEVTGSEPVRMGAPVTQLEWLPIVRLDHADGGRVFEQARLEGFVIASRFLIDNTPFDLYPIKAESHFRMHPGGRYFVMPVPVDGWAGLDAGGEDYVLIRWVDQPDTTGPGVGWTSDGTFRVGRFVPDPPRGIRFITDNSVQRTIGTEIEPSLKVVGYIEAIFKRSQT